jgi:hypothetical protein
MKTFVVKSFHDVYLDNYENGEGEQVHSYSLKSEINANDKKEAIQKYFDEFLFLSFDYSLCHEEENEIQYSNLVNIENEEATEEQKELWRNDKAILYTNISLVKVFELTQV